MIQKGRGLGCGAGIATSKLRPVTAVTGGHFPNRGVAGFADITQKPHGLSNTRFPETVAGVTAVTYPFDDKTLHPVFGQSSQRGSWKGIAPITNTGRCSFGPIIAFASTAELPAGLDGALTRIQDNKKPREHAGGPGV